MAQGIVIWAVLDPANPFISPTSAPFVIGLAYAKRVPPESPFFVSTNATTAWYGASPTSPSQQT